MNLLNKIALITGAARGMGQAFTDSLLSRGAKVSMCDINTEQGQKTYSELRSRYGSSNVIFFKCDVTSQEEFENVVQMTCKKFGKLDILMNNAGVGGENNWQTVVKVNLIGTIYGIHLALKYMGLDMGREGGTVINMGSLSGVTPTPLTPVYSAAKHGVVSLTRSYGDKLYYKRTGVKMLCLCPSFVDTYMLHTLDTWGTTPQIRNIIQKAKEKFPCLSPEEVSEFLIRLIMEGENGTVWVVRAGKPELVVPAQHFEF